MDALLEPPWPFRTAQGERANLVGTLAGSRSEGHGVDPVDIDFKPALRLPSWWIPVPVAVATFAFWAVVLADETPESSPVTLSLRSILVEPGFEEQRVREIAEGYLDDVRECHARLQTRPEGPVHIPLHLVVQPTGIVGSAGLKYVVTERKDLADCVIEKATHWKFPRPSIPHFVGVTIDIELSPQDRSRPVAAAS